MQLQKQRKLYKFKQENQSLHQAHRADWANLIIQVRYIKSLLFQIGALPGYSAEPLRLHWTLN